MARTIALSRIIDAQGAQYRAADLARGLIVLGCSAALIFAGQPLPF
ncbi:MAG: hypothetical protein V2J51_11755 [Erythrobacter sp.]|jgi:hypothetical protein|nr:hypothetical protein [Erythrobacter sp.]